MGLRAENYINLRKKFNVKGDAFALNEYLLLKRKYTKRGRYIWHNFGLYTFRIMQLFCFWLQEKKKFEVFFLFSKNFSFHFFPIMMCTLRILISETSRSMSTWFITRIISSFSWGKMGRVLMTIEWPSTLRILGYVLVQYLKKTWFLFHF